MNKATLRIAMDAAQAQRLAAALAPDNGTHADARAGGDVLVVTAESGTPLGLLRTIEDVLASVRGTLGTP